MRNARLKCIRRRALALGAAAFLAACGQPRPPASGPIAQGPAQPGAAAPAAVDPRGPVQVALLVPLTGADPRGRLEAQGLADAAQLAARESGERGLRLSVLDTGGRPDGAAEAARKAADEGAALILGPLFAQNARAAAQAVADRGLNVVAFSTTAEVAGGNLWLLGSLPRTEAERIVGYAAAQGLPALALFHPDTAYGQTARAALRAAAARHGASVVAAAAYERSFEGIQEAAEPFAAQLLAAGANAVALPDQGQGLSAAAAFLNYHGVSPLEVKYLGLSGWQDPASLREPALRGGWFAAPDPAPLEAFAERFAAAYGRPPTALAPLGHDAVVAAATMLRRARAEGLDAPFAAEALTDPRGFIGAMGAFRLTPDGLNERALAVLEVDEDGFTVIDPAPAAAPGAPGV
ncbi:penicillin-binding protein activator [Oceanicella actignis]|uniref:ABC-type branched-chain amino acid transport system, substrate-binding protein n=1 Tax=Oceanicella actignis TaxID=1189325 RepID=A0A1M7TB88_9RHOB|nr:penicillin-binding protein activator [Oceanicella actignis]SET53207.1 ABC-type branched-chain amino acid transport system, substrate-binding protein [Oceanicella actignis]SHN67963.1 ABC-type branched-chain amino acid transport system, substrate-binding protein [Oceanicella actignis]